MSIYVLITIICKGDIWPLPQGVGRAQSAGLLTALATQAAALEPGRENPVLTITTKHQ